MFYQNCHSSVPLLDTFKSNEAAQCLKLVAPMVSSQATASALEWQHRLDKLHMEQLYTEKW